MVKEPDPTGGPPQWDRVDWLILIGAILLCAAIVAGVALVVDPSEACR
ncbi:hypothetical protein [Cereibacter sphaeroides]|nr:hypothetical protein [Cereibacter sphaeroides]